MVDSVSLLQGHTTCSFLPTGTIFDVVKLLSAKEKENVTVAAKRRSGGVF
jgi:hypothetical protein